MQTLEPSGRCFERDPDVEVGHALALGVQVVKLNNHHVTAVAAPAVKVPGRRRAVLLRRHNFEELITDRVEPMSKSKISDSGVSVTNLEPEVVDELLLDRAKIVGDKNELTKSEHDSGLVVTRGCLVAAELIFHEASERYGVVVLEVRGHNLQSAGQS